MSEPPQETRDPIAAAAAAKRIAAIRAWQKERLEDLASGKGGFAHREPSVQDQQPASSYLDVPPEGLVGRALQAAEITPAELPAEPQSETVPPRSGRSADLPGESPPEPVEHIVSPGADHDEEAPASTTPAGQGGTAVPRPGMQGAMLKDSTGDAVKQKADVEFETATAGRAAAPEKHEALRILVYESIWLIALAVTLLTLPMFRIIPDAAQLISAGLFGALGGTVGAVVSLWRQTSSQGARAPLHHVWFYGQPIIGFPLGMFVFLVLQITVVYSAGTGSAVIHPALLNLACAYAGFRQDILSGFGSLFRLPAKRQ